MVGAVVLARRPPATGDAATDEVASGEAAADRPGETGATTEVVAEAGPRVVPAGGGATGTTPSGAEVDA